ncbi:hypothetical protein MUK70_01470 [Dyadobacter chenwenxiniae]|uniref:hypothetical protein n=1 Tax=Dyadobacter chenwenxiniae TaxID=2906456 RepID=UPI001FCFEBC7|nr:hypothetical protein [Dyadobacter chenwenxiniae]UON83672.1 hypothetical protein MUK70_01470 [Dyadobacter chenwenxiniae]
MFQALNYYMGSSVRDTAQVSAATMANMYTNTGSPFKDISTSTINIKGADLNGSGVQLKDVTASSKTTAEKEAAQAYLATSFASLETASKSVKAGCCQRCCGQIGNLSGRRKRN